MHDNVIYVLILIFSRNCHYIQAPKETLIPSRFIVRGTKTFLSILEQLLLHFPLISEIINKNFDLTHKLDMHAHCNYLINSESYTDDSKSVFDIPQNESVVTKIAAHKTGDFWPVDLEDMVMCTLITSS